MQSRHASGIILPVRVVVIRMHSSGGVLEMVGEPFFALPEGCFYILSQKGSAALYCSAPQLFLPKREVDYSYLNCSMSTLGSWLRSRPRATQSFSSWFRGRTGLRIRAEGRMPLWYRASFRRA